MAEPIKVVWHTQGVWHWSLDADDAVYSGLCATKKGAHEAADGLAALLGADDATQRLRDLQARAEAAEARAAQAEADARLMAGLAFASFVERTSFSPEIVEASLLDALEDASDVAAAAPDAGLVAAVRRILATAGAT